MFNPNKVLSVAAAEIGYLGHKTPDQLDNPTANAGYTRGHTYTKFGKYLDDLGWVFNSKKNGYAWCAQFVTYCFFKAFGDRNGQALLVQHDRCSAAGCGEAMTYFQRKKQFYGRGQGQPGDQIFFCDSSGQNVVHTGIVESVSGNYLTTIEGNASNSVKRKSYGIWDGRIVGFGRPNWSMAPVGPVPGEVKEEPQKPVEKPVEQPAEQKPAEQPAPVSKPVQSEPKATEVTITLPVLKEGDKGDIIKNLQALLQRYKTFSGTINGKFDAKTASAVRSFQNGKNLKITKPAEVNRETWERLIKG